MVFHWDSGCCTLTTVRHLHKQHASNSSLIMQKHILSHMWCGYKFTNTQIA